MFAKARSRVFEHGEVVNLSFSYTKPNGETFYFDAKLAPEHDEHGEVRSILAVVRDITEHKEAEERERKLQLEQERRRLLKNFVQNAAHEFRTPLTTISTSSYMMSRLDNPDHRARSAGQIDVQIKRITRLVDSLLLMTKLENNEVLTGNSIDIDTVVRALCEKEDKGCSKNHHIHYDIQPDLLPVMGDAEYLSDALKQIMDNACRFTPAGGKIEVKVVTGDDCIQIEIRDSGPGIPQDALPYIFETFWRQDTAHSTPGFGLGLPIAQKIIEQHGGGLTVESEPGQGTTVRVNLPMLESKDAI